MAQAPLALSAFTLGCQKLIFRKVMLKAANIVTKTKIGHAKPRKKERVLKKEMSCFHDTSQINDLYMQAHFL